MDGTYVSDRVCQKCPGHCKNDEFCNKTNGNCDNGCRNYWTGYFCHRMYIDYFMYQQRHKQQRLATVRNFAKSRGPNCKVFPV